MYLPVKGTGMVASSSTFRPRLERVIGDLFHILHAVRHGTEELHHNNYPMEAASSTCLAIIFEWLASDVPAWFLHSYTQLRGLSDLRIAELCFEQQKRVSGHGGMSGGNSPRHAQNSLSGERRETLSITHYALSLPLSHHHLDIFIN